MANLIEKRAGEIAALADRQTDETIRSWCETVGHNNPPGQKVYVDDEAFAKAEGVASKPKGEAKPSDNVS